MPNIKAEAKNSDFNSLTPAQQNEWLKENYRDYEVDWNYVHNVQICERSKTVIEPLISTEWFVKMTAENGIRDKALRKLNTTKEIEFHPSRFKEQAQDFLDGLRDWVISRNLWWGHRFPVWYCDDCNQNHEFFAPSEFIDGKPPKGVIIWPNLGNPEKCICCNSTNLVQDERVLDTWFSSSLWPLIMTGFNFTEYLTKKGTFEKFPELKN